MAQELTLFNERDLQKLVLDRLYGDIAGGPKLLPRKQGREKLHLGSFVLDFVVGNEAGGLTVIEFKVNAHHGTFGQLLLYPRAVQRALQRPVPISIVLISTHIDRGVVDLMSRVRVKGWDLRALLATGTTQSPRLVSPGDDCSEQQFWDRAEASDQQRDDLHSLLGS